ASYTITNLQKWVGLYPSCWIATTYVALPQSQSRISIGRGNVTKSRGIISRRCIAIIICHSITSRSQDLASRGKGIIASSTRVACGIALAYIYSFKTYTAKITGVSAYQTVACAVAFVQGFQTSDVGCCGSGFGLFGVRYCHKLCGAHIGKSATCVYLYV